MLNKFYQQKRAYITLLLSKQKETKALRKKCFPFAMMAVLIGLIPLASHGQTITRDLCDPGNMCEITYRLFDTYDDGWDGDAYIQVMHSGVEVAELRIGYGESGETRSLSLCNGEAYSFVWVCGSCDDECSFVFYDPSGDIIPAMNYSEGEVPYGEEGEQFLLLSDFVIQCPTCQKPQNFRKTEVTSSSVTLAWSVGIEVTEWQLEYFANGSETIHQTNVTWQAGMGDVVTEQIEGLDAATQYTVKLRAVCIDDEYSSWVQLSFYTECGTVVVDEANPFVEDFDSYEPYDPYGGEPWKGVAQLRSGENKLPFCWSSWNGGNYLDEYDWYEYYDYPYMIYDYQSASNCLKFMADNYEEYMVDQYAILPSMQDISGLQMTFNAQVPEGSMNSISFSVGVMTDPTDPDSFYEIQTLMATDDWNNYAVYFNQYEGQGEHIAIKLPTPDYQEYTVLLVDDIVISVMPSCLIPQNVAVSNVEGSTAAVSWTYPLDTDGLAWQIQYSTDRTNWSCVASESISLQLTGLIPNNYYYLRVRTDCGEGDFSAWSSVVNFRTICEGNQALPYFEDFDTYPMYEYPWQRLPQGWTYINTSHGQYNLNEALPCMSNDGYPNNYLYFWIVDYDNLNHHAGYDPKPQYAIMPRMDNLDGVVMKFSGRSEQNNAWDTFNSVVNIGVMDDGGFHQIVSFDLDDHYFEQHTVNINGFTNGGYITFMVDVPTGNQDHSLVRIDDIQVYRSVTAEKPVTGFGTGTENWHLIASPLLKSVSPNSVNNLVTANAEDYDLFMFDNTQVGAEWRNYKNHNFSIVNGEGYLYANKEDVTLQFAGPLLPEVANKMVNLSFTESVFGAWNLIGNPFNADAYLANGMAYYRMNSEGTELTSEAAGVSIAPMEGVFVQATGNGQIAVFTKTQQRSNGNLNFRLCRDHGQAIDNAIISFGEGSSLVKFMLNANASKIYFTENDLDYSIVNGGQMGEQPLNFKAVENGLFTLVANLEDIDLGYLHLVDNLTGKDINLLETPSYTFEAKTSDYVSRFKVVFAQGNSVNDETFAFMRDGHLLVFGQESEATLQVIDMTGRILSSETFNGSYDKEIGFNTGLYVLRLISGENMRTQKIIIK